MGPIHTIMLGDPSVIVRFLLLRVCALLEVLPRYISMHFHEAAHRCRGDCGRSGHR